MPRATFTAITQRKDDGFVSLCPELDIASQGATREEARRSLAEAIEGFFEAASPSEIQRRLGAERSVDSLEVAR